MEGSIFAKSTISFVMSFQVRDSVFVDALRWILASRSPRRAEEKVV